MMVGGNGPCAAFLEQHGIPARTPIRAKYDSKAGEVYKTKIDSLAEGKDWKPPANLSEILKQPKQSSSPLKTNNSLKNSSEGVKKNANISRGNGDTIKQDDWDWDDDSAASKKDAYFGNSSKGSPQESNTRRQTGSGSGGGYGASQSNSDKYSKFGNQRAISSAEFFGEEEPVRKGDDQDVLKALGEGWNRFSAAALEVSKTATEKLKQSTAEISKTVQEKSWGQEAASVGTKLSETTGKGWNLVQDYWNKARESASEFATQLNQPNHPMSNQPTYQANNSGLSAGQQDDPWSGFESRESEISRGFYGESDGKPRADLTSDFEQKEQSTEDLEDWLNDDQPKEKPKKSTPKQKKKNQSKPTDDDWDNWGEDEEVTTTKPSPAQQTKKKEKVEGWENWDDEW